MSKAGRIYRQSIQAMCWGETYPLDVRLKVVLIANPPDRRRRDLDNVLKALLDSLQHAGIYRDDAQIDDLHIIRGKQVKDGNIIADIEVI